MIDTSENRELLASYLAGYDIELAHEQLGLLLQHLDLVVEKNKVMNLTRIVDPDDAIIRHVVDSLLLLPALCKLSVTQKTRYVDIGTGAGFPGVPLGIVLDCQGLLIDSVGKKVTAVNEFCQTLGLKERITAEAIRAEDLARREPGRFDLVMARAVADLGVLIEYASPLLKRGGHLVVSKARISEEEITRGEKTASLVGMRLIDRKTYELPKNSGHREMLTYVHDSKSKVRLPRNTGMAKHNPLA